MTQSMKPIIAPTGTAAITHPDRPDRSERARATPDAETHRFRVGQLSVAALQRAGTTSRC